MIFLENNMVIPVGNNRNDGVVHQILAQIGRSIPVGNAPAGFPESISSRPNPYERERIDFNEMGVHTDPAQDKMNQIHTPVQKFAPILKAVESGDLQTAKEMWQQLSDGERDVILDLKRGDITLKYIFQQLEEVANPIII